MKKRESACVRVLLFVCLVGFGSPLVSLVLLVRVSRSKHTKASKNTVYQNKTQPANFRGYPLYQATKRHLNSS